MPRRRALTEAQLDALFALPVDEARLIRHWTLGLTQHRCYQPQSKPDA